MASKRAVSNTVVAILVIVILALGAYIAIGTPGLERGGVTTTTTARAAPNPDTLIHETIGKPDFLDPAVDYETSGGEIIQNVYETLVWYDRDKISVIPWLAKSFEVSSDGLTYTFELREGIKFHDGTPFNATAVKYSFDRMIIINDPDSAIWMYSGKAAGNIKGSPEYTTSKMTNADVKAYKDAKGVEVLGTYKVTIHLDKPYAAFLSTLAFQAVSIVSPSFVEAHGGVVPGKHNEYMDTQGMSGTGPYKLKSYDAGTGTVTLERNENYWGGPGKTGLAKIKNVIRKQVSDPNTLLLDIKAGTTDIAYVPATHIFNLIDKDKWLNDGKIVSTAEGVAVPGPFGQLNTNFIGLNLDIRNPDKTLAEFQPFKDKRVRQAFFYAFDFKTWAKDAVNGFSKPLKGVIPDGLMGYDPNLPYPVYNATIAKQLLLEAVKAGTAGFSPQNPKTIVLKYNSGNIGREKAAILLASTLNQFTRDTGLSVVTQPVAWPTLLSELRTKQLAAFAIGWLVDYPDPDDFLVPFADGRVGNYALWMGYNNSAVNKLIDEQSVDLNPTTRLQKIIEVQKMYNEDYVAIWRGQATIYGQNSEVMRDWVKGFYFNGAYPGLYYYSLSKG